MPYPFPKDESFEGSSDSLIEHVPRLKKRAARRSRWSLLKIFLVSLAVGVGLIEMVVLETIFVYLTTHDQAPQLLSELNKLVPEFAVRQVLFRKDAAATWDHQSEESRNATYDDWLSYFPRGNGFMAVNNSNQYTLPDPILFRGKEAYSIAVFHQLHCLYTIMNVYNDMSSSAGHHRRDSGDHAHEHEHPHEDQDPEESMHRHNHVDHCFRYLRQSLVCCGDTALEGQDPNTDDFGTDGTGAVHVCKDYDAIRSWADANRLVDAKHT